MVEFNLWIESFIFGIIYSIIIVIPCILVALMGRGMIDRLGTWPSQTPVIQMSILLRLVFLEIMTFACLILFYHIFAGR